MPHCWPGLSWAVFSIPLGALFCYISIVAWRNPASKLVQSTFAEPYPTENDAYQIYRWTGWTKKNVRDVNLAIMKTAGPIIGILLVADGVRRLVLYFACSGR